MASADHEPKTYRRTPLLIRNYFALRCQVEGYAGEWEEEKGEDKLGFPTFRITVKSERCDRVMQRVLMEDNGYE